MTQPSAPFGWNNIEIGIPSATTILAAEPLDALNNNNSNMLVEVEKDKSLVGTTDSSIRRIIGDDLLAQLQNAEAAIDQYQLACTVFSSPAEQEGKLEDLKTTQMQSWENIHSKIVKKLLDEHVAAAEWPLPIWRALWFAFSNEDMFEESPSDVLPAPLATEIAISFIESRKLPKQGSFSASSASSSSTVDPERKAVAWAFMLLREVAFRICQCCCACCQTCFGSCNGWFLMSLLGYGTPALLSSLTCCLPWMVSDKCRPCERTIIVGGEEFGGELTCVVKALQIDESNGAAWAALSEYESRGATAEECICGKTEFQAAADRCCTSPVTIRVGGRQFTQQEAAEHAIEKGHGTWAVWARIAAGALDRSKNGAHAAGDDDEDNKKIITVCGRMYKLLVPWTNQQHGGRQHGVRIVPIQLEQKKDVDKSCCYQRRCGMLV